ncbi:MAG TPA: Ig-like domain-containing protein [Nocardioides sp.]|uniref:Ig-like domain-containing protein n=1 Tax=Nocardioides sp. TaxID=35761 RepID=UPI002BDF95A0|nr:Ig-like domain-containing protein [Nocardioides sp.]HTW17845.1 Ig-like domain-containing protein [Nocardioides sp.]
MKVTASTRWRRLALVPLFAGLALPGYAPTQAVAAAPPTAADELVLPDPMDRGEYTPRVIQEAKLGTVALHEPNSAGGAPTPNTAAAAEDLEIRGQLYYPDFSQRTERSPVLVLVHGNHGSCDSGQDSANASCAQFKRNEAGYAYLSENLATWGYTTFSVSQDQLMMRQDNAKGKGMHQRRMLIAATLDALGAADAGTLVDGEHVNVGTTLAGHLDMTRIGLMGHSRGGDAVTNFIDYNRIRTDGPRYPLRGVISLAQVDYERKAPYGVPFMSILPFCDGDVSNLQGARTFERSQYLDGSDPFPRIQSSQLGAIHNWYNTVWYADGGADGQNNNDAACGNSAPFANTNVHPNNLRLSGAASSTDPAGNYVIDNSDTYNPLVNTKISGDPARMGDQEKIGLATMAAFFRRYVGGEGAFEPYMTGELSDTESHLQIPATACPTSTSGTRIGCEEYVSTSYFPSAAERVDVIRPEIENPLGLNALGGTLSGSGFANPYVDGNGVSPKPRTTAGGYDWCNPEPDDFAPAQLGKGTQPTAAKACPLPGKAELGGQNGTRENSPVNHSYGRQLALAWEQGSTARLTADIPAASADVSGLKALAMGADVNFFDLRNPGADNRGDNTRTGTSPNFAWPNELPTSYDPASTTQDFVIALTDAAGREGTVKAGDERWGNALHMSTGTNTANTHIVLDQIRVPLSEFAAQGVDLTEVAEVELRFGTAGTPASGSIQLADVRFQEAVDAPLILSDGTDVDQGAGSGPVTSGPDPAAVMAAYDNTRGSVLLNDNVADPFANTSWVVDDDKAQCPTANFTSIQQAVDFASPWDTIVVCEGVYEESSTPVSGPGNPVSTSATNGLTITKPLKIKGAGADKVTIKPDPSIDSLAGLKPYLRDGGGNVITVSRQSLGSTDTNELFVDISGVTVTSGDTWAEAGIAYFGAAGRVSQSVVGPLRAATTADELAEHPHGWGIVKTGVVEGAGTGTVETELTVADSVVTGYQSGGILIDGAKGVDGGPNNVARTGIEQHGYVSGTVVRGKANSLYPQTGVKFTSGADGFVRSSRITGNYFRPDPSTSYGILLTDARTETAGALTASGNVLTGNGWAAYNANAENTAVRTGAPFVVSSSYFGPAAPVAGGPADADTGAEAISGSSSVTVSSRASTVPGGIPTSYGVVADEAPTAELVDPFAGTEVAVGTTVKPLVRAGDDFAVRKVTLLVDGKPVADAERAPYLFTWTPAPSYAGRSVSLTTVVTDSSGTETTSAPLRLTVAKAPVVVTPPKPTVSASVAKRDTRKGIVVLNVKVNGAGTIRLAGGRIAATRTKVAGPGTVKVRVAAKGAYRKLLVRKGRISAPVRITFTAEGGTAVTKRTVTLVRKKR